MSRPIEIALAGRPAPCELIFFDCDGVIFDTNAAKSAAFDYAVADYPKPAREALVAHHQQSGGISRYVKLRTFFTEICPVEDVDGAVDRALERFGAFSRQAYDELEPLPEALRFAEAVGARERGYVISGADQEELREVFEAKGIADRFVAVLGSPDDKPTHVRRILAEREVEPRQALFIGDGRGDFECADEMGLWFVFLAEMSDWTDGRQVVSRAQDRFASRGVGAVVADRWEELSTWLVG